MTIVVTTKTHATSPFTNGALELKAVFMETRMKELASPTISVNFAELKRFSKSAEECESELGMMWL